jgi:hypothetical protein
MRELQGKGMRPHEVRAFMARVGLETPSDGE